MQDGIVRTAANIDPAWIGFDAAAALAALVPGPVHVVNDADAAGVAEAAFGAARGRAGVVLVTTLGTGIGSALIADGRLVPNTELGHLEVDGHPAEQRAATSALHRDGLSYRDWAARLTVFYRHVERILAPDLIVVGGAGQLDARRVPAVRRDPDAHHGSDPRQRRRCDRGRTARHRPGAGGRAGGVRRS